MGRGDEAGYRKEALIKDGPVIVSSLRAIGQRSGAQLPIGAAHYFKGNRLAS